MQSSSEQSGHKPSPLAAQRIQAERMHDVSLLLKSLAEREKVNILLIIDCLYDVGSINLINNQFSSRSLNGICKLIAKTSKPVFRVIAWRWFSNNISPLLTEWLTKKVSFEDGDTKGETKTETETETESVPKPTSELPPSQLTDTDTEYLQQVTQEVKMLRSQVTLLTGMLIGVITIFGGGSIWLSYNFPVESPRIPQSVDFLQKSSNE